MPYLSYADHAAEEAVPVSAELLPANRKIKYPTTPETILPESTPIRTARACSGSSNARVPMNKLMVNPIPVSNATP